MSETIVSILHQRASTTPDEMAYRFHPHGDMFSIDWTYSQVYSAATTLSHQITAYVNPGDRVVLSLDPGLHFIAALFAIFQVGAVAVPSFPAQGGRAAERFISICRNCSPKLVIAEVATKPTLARYEDSIASPQSQIDWLFLDSQDYEIFNKTSDQWSVDFQANLNPALIQYTSGSTGSPKGVVISHANLLSNSACLDSVMSPLGPHIGFTWLPPYHDMGLMGALLLSIYSGFPLHLMSPGHFIQQPFRWLKLMSEFGVTSTVGPNFALERCIAGINDEEVASLRLSKLKLLFCGAEPIRGATLDQFADKFASSGFDRGAFLPCYGLAEATLFVSGTSSKQAKSADLFCDTEVSTENQLTAAAGVQTAVRFVGCGGVTKGHEVIIVNPDTRQRISDHSVGEIWVRGPNVADGYFQDEVATEKTFRGRIAGEHDGIEYLRTGDLGTLRNGELFITGRMKEIINLHGRNHYPQDFESTILELQAGFRSNGIVAFSVEVDNTERLIVAAELSRSSRLSSMELSSLRRRIVEATTASHGVSPHAVLLVLPASIPLTTSGKIQRTACRKRYLDDGFATRLLKPAALPLASHFKDGEALA